MQKVKPVIDETWFVALKNDFESNYFQSLKEFLVEEKSKYTVYPPGSLIFNAFNLTPLDRVKVVILGQDPYHGEGQAHGLCFSVPTGVKLPPSLKNIYKEIESDLGVKMPLTGNLESWARQGVLLINATLTVRARQAGSHQGKGWEDFTDSAISKVSEQCDGVVFILWGNYAQAKEPLIDKQKHYVLKAPHPSPFSVYRGFFGCKHFSKANELLKKTGKSEIIWEDI